MKRVVMLVDDALRRSDAYALTTTAPDGSTIYFAVSLDRVESVEDVPDPLPTEPGARFWGCSEHFGPQWWFVTAGSGCVNGGIDYVAAEGVRIMGEQADRHGLVSLPDPGEVTP